MNDPLVNECNMSNHYIMYALWMENIMWYDTFNLCFSIMGSGLHEVVHTSWLLSCCCKSRSIYYFSCFFWNHWVQRSLLTIFLLIANLRFFQGNILDLILVLFKFSDSDSDLDLLFSDSENSSLNSVSENLLVKLFLFHINNICRFFFFVTRDIFLTTFVLCYQERQVCIMKFLFLFLFCCPVPQPLLLLS